MLSESTSTRNTFLKRHSLAIRIWHWLLFLLISGSMLTVLLNSTILKSRNNIALVKNELLHSGINVTDGQARGVAHEFSDRIWLVHKITGYLVLFFLFGRIVIEFFQPSAQRFFTRLKNAAGFYSKAEAKAFYRHYLWVRYGYLAFYLLILTMGLTGLVLAYEDSEFLKPIHETAKFIHEYGQYAIYAYVFLHIAGVTLGELGSEKGLVSGMIHGNKDLPEESATAPLP